MDTNQTPLFIAILITCIVVAVVMTYFIATIIRQQRRNIELYKSKILTEITILENERTRIAHDLHDEMGPVLSSVKFRINNIYINTDEDKEEIFYANKHIDNIIQQMRSISNNLFPIVLERKGLIYAMNETIDNIGNPGGLNIQFSYDDIPELPQDKSVNLYRILQEIIHNTIKHAKASDLKIEITLNNGTLYIVSGDNGQGFDHDSQIMEGSGSGLRSMLSRTEIMGGEMFIESGKKKGTKFIFEIPLS